MEACLVTGLLLGSGALIQKISFSSLTCGFSSGFLFFFIYLFFSYGKTGVYSKLRHEFVRVDLEISNMEMSTCPS